MNKHLQQIIEEDERTRRGHKKAFKRGLMSVLLCCGLFMLAVYASDFLAPEVNPNDAPLTELPERKAALDNSDIDYSVLPWNLTLVNRDHPLSKDFTVRLVNLNGYKVSAKLKSPLEQMIAAAKKDGVDLSICSAYRSVSYQSGLYEGRMKDAMKKGLSREEAALEVERYTQPPAASEHHTGLAVDFLTSGVSNLNEKFANTKAYTWLEEHATKFGFIQRYPKGYETLTGIYWEPWHYRFVGIGHAEEIASRNITLEEYCAEIAEELKEAQ